VNRPAPEENREQRRAEIVRTALRLLQEGGLERLSLRRVAHALEMHPPGLYWYIENKQELIDLMAAQILDEVRDARPPSPGGQTWEAWLTEASSALRRGLLAWRDGARVVAGAYPFRTDAIARGLERSLEIMEAAGFTRDAAMLAVVTTMRYTIGIALDEQASAPIPPEAVQRRLDGAPLGPHVDAARFPRVGEVMGRWVREMWGQSDDPGEVHFLRGLAILIAGIRASPGSPDKS
jgi:TetR/AcrR family tetracycline transcriptional repressor